MTKLRERLSATYRKLNGVQYEYDLAIEDVLSERRHRLERIIECMACLCSADICMVLIPSGHTHVISVWKH